MYADAGAAIGNGWMRCCFVFERMHFKKKSYRLLAKL
jgi:hypothetical protein